MSTKTVLEEQNMKEVFAQVILYLRRRLEKEAIESMTKDDLHNILFWIFWELGLIKEDDFHYPSCYICPEAIPRIPKIEKLVRSLNTRKIVFLNGKLTSKLIEGKREVLDEDIVNLVDSLVRFGDEKIA